MILSCNNISKAFGTESILQNVSFNIEEREKAAIVGINGAGKSTLLKIIVGELNPDEGIVTISKGKTFGYLAQHQNTEGDTTIYDELMEVKKPILLMEQQIRSIEHQMKDTEGEELEKLLDTYTKLNHEFEMANGYAWQSEIVGVLKGLGFPEDEYHKPLYTLSGGQKTRVALGRLLLSKPDILLLDEPTNHLDMASITWLETYLMNYDGTVIIVAHDRYFLDRVTNKIIELDGGKATSYIGNYTDYNNKKAIVRAGILKAYLNQQQDIKHQEEVIAKLKSFNREKSIKRAESREKRLAKIQILEKPTEINSTMSITLEPAIVSGNDVLNVEGLSKSYGSNHLFEGINMDIKRGERVAIIGNNGTGKTTILKILNGLVDADAGEIRLGSKVEIGYYDQEHHVLHMDKTLFEEISDTYPEMTNTEIRNILAAFLFTGDDVFKRISDLSGGERGRVSLAKLMLSESNFLILDEPTNHLDINSKEILENALVNYTGTVLYVSHDRYFINKTATRILDLNGHQLLNYIGNYDYYLEKKADVEAANSVVSEAAFGVQAAGGAGAGLLKSVTSTSKSGVTESQLDWKAQKEEQALLRKKQNELKKVEDEIHKLETRDAEIDTLLCDEAVFTDVPRLMELNKEKEAISDKLLELYEKWEELA